MICHVVFLLRDFVWWQFCSNLLVFRIMSCGIVTLLSSCQASDLNFESDLVGSCQLVGFGQLFCFYCFSPLFHIFFLMVCFPFNSYCRLFRFFETHSLPRMQCNATVCALPKINEIKMAQNLLYRLSQKMHVPRRFSPNQWDDLAFRWEHLRNTFLPQFFCIRTKNRSSSIGFFGKWARLLNRWHGRLLTS